MSQITHLYIKTHNITGLKYFGKTVRDPFKYLGSGKYWKRHLKIHGTDISTVVVASFGESQKEEMVEFSLFFSEFYNIVESKEWANLSLENGLDGASPGRIVSTETKNKISNSLFGRTESLETRKKKSEWAKRRSYSKENIEKMKKSNTGKHRSEETKLKLSIANKGKSPPIKGKKHSEETKLKMSLSAKGNKKKPQSAEHILKRVAAYKATIEKKKLVNS